MAATKTKPDQSPKDVVTIRPKGDGDDVAPSPTTRRAFERVWESRGYVIVDDPSAPAKRTTTPVGSDA